MTLATLRRAEVADLRWRVRPDPVLQPPFPSPVIADPTFLPPDQTPGGDWRLWAHSLLGLHAYRCHPKVEALGADLIEAVRGGALDVADAESSMRQPSA